MSVLLDTNLLLRSAQPTHSLRQVAADAIAALRAQGEQLCLAPQNLYEYWVVCTRPVAQNGLGMTAAETAKKITEHKQLFRIVDDTPAILPEWERLVSQHQVLGKNAHDARLVATMLLYSIPRIITFNAQDFHRYPGIVVLSPHDVLRGLPTSGTQGSIP